jgi:predicted nucleotidyltransferase
MLARAVRTFRGIKCVGPEDLIGLKIQAYKNDPRRELQDRADIQRLIETTPSLDWERIKDYADLFSEWPTIEDLRRRAEWDGR